jgi:hypothetical protein
MAAFPGPPGSGEQGWAAPPGFSTAQPRQPRQPSLLWLIPGVAILIGGAAWLVVGLVGLSNQVNALQRVPYPGQGQVTLAHSGRYVIYYEGIGAQTGNVPQGQIDVRSLSASATAPTLSPYMNNLSYTFGSRSGTAVETLQIAQPGTYQVTATSDTAPPGADLAIGPSFAGSLVTTIVGSVLVILAGIAALVVVLARRGVARKRWRRMMMYGPPGGYR